MYARFLKRPLDFLSAVIALLVLLPLMTVTAIAIRLEDGGPALFRQRRVGRGGRPFHIFKFRSMPVNVADVPSAHATTLPVTRVGRLIRRANVDELPQLFNILRGEMSIVGPRPALPAQERLIALRLESGALACRPGLTGLAQISAYSGMLEDEKAGYDATYARDITFARDAAIVLRTVGYLFRPPPVY